MYTPHGVYCMSELVPGVVILLIPYMQKASLREGEGPVRATVSFCEVRPSEPRPSLSLALYMAPQHLLEILLIQEG